jgi:trans-aconitate 2-methyltransferase
MSTTLFLISMRLSEPCSESMPADFPRSREWDSGAYHRVSAPQFSWGKKVVERLSVRGDETVLDAGCGTGKLTRELLLLLPRGRVVALDLSRNMLSAARENLVPEFAGRAEFVAADLQHLPFQDVFQGIFSTAAFHWVPDHIRLYRSLYGALLPGGWLVAQCGGAGNLNRLFQRLAHLTQSSPFAQYLRDFKSPWAFLDPATSKTWLHDAGFVDIETSLEPAPTRFENAERYIEFVRNVILHRHLEQLPDQELQYELLERLASQAAKDNPPWELDYWRLNLDAKKPKL